MSCTNPKTAWQQKFSCLVTRKMHKPIFRKPSSYTINLGLWRELKLPCCRCPSCRLEYSRQWALRGVCELQMHERSSFVTLTYAPKHLPKSGSLIKRHYQKFFKRLRKHGYKFTYMVAGEYGTRLGRPHYHVIFFGEDFKQGAESAPFLQSEKFPLWQNKKLTKLWGKGHVVCGFVSIASIRYVASYITNRVYGSEQALKSHYGDKIPEFMQPSLKPAIGLRWIEKFHTDVFPSDEFIYDGLKMKPPKYFFNWLKKKNPSLALDISEKRAIFMESNKDKFTLERAIAREEIMLSRFKNKMRALDAALAA